MLNSAKQLNILVIEDNAGDLMLIEDYLQEEVSQPRIKNVKSFTAAKETLSTAHGFDAVLLDLTLPDASGERLVSDMVALCGDTPVIVLTGYTEKEFGIRTLSLGISDYLLKDDLSASQLYKSILYSIERKRINMRLKTSEEEYRNLFQLSPLPMWVFDLETLKFLNVNEAALRHYGYTVDEFRSLTVKDIRLPEEYDKMDKMLDIYARTDSFFFVDSIRHRKKNNELIHVEIKSNLISFDGRKAVLVLVNDVTENLARQEQVIKSNQKLQTAQEIGKMGYWELDLQTNQLFWSDEVFNILVVSSGSQLTFDSFYRMIHPDDLPLFDKNREETLSGSCSVFEMEHRVFDTTGTLKYVYEKGNVIYNDKNNAIRFEGIIQDITEHIQHQHEIEEQNKRLREIAWTQSHIVRAPLSRIMGLVNLISNYTSPNTETNEYLGHILTSAQELDTVIKDIVKKTEEIDRQ